MLFNEKCTTGEVITYELGHAMGLFNPSSQEIVVIIAYFPVGYLDIYFHLLACNNCYQAQSCRADMDLVTIISQINYEVRNFTKPRH